MNQLISIRYAIHTAILCTTRFPWDTGPSPNLTQ